MKKFTPLLLAFLLSLLTACTPTRVSIEQNLAPTTDITNSIHAEVPADSPELNILDFDPRPLINSKKGEYVLAPLASALDAFYKDDSNPLIFHKQEMLEPGRNVSRLMGTTDGKHKVPNALILPIPTGQTAKIGDIVLTWWQSGSGMIKAIVIEGGTAEEPMVKYLDLDIERVPEQLQANSFVKLTGDIMPGTPVISKDDDSFFYETLICINNGRVLTEGWGGVLYSRSESDVTPIKIYKECQLGDDIYVPVFGEYKAGTIIAHNRAIGEVTVMYDNYGKETEEIFKVTEITRALD